MSRKTCYPHKYLCSCGEIQKHYVWSDEIEEKKHKCDNKDCDKEVGYDEIQFPEEVKAPFVGKMGKEAIRNDRTDRRLNHFKKEILPTLGSDEQRHFKAKGYKAK